MTGKHEILIRKPERKSPSGRPKCRWEVNIKTDLQVVGCELDSITGREFLNHLCYYQLLQRDSSMEIADNPTALILLEEITFTQSVKKLSVMIPDG
jgi:hypothetical protein